MEYRVHISSANVRIYTFRSPLWLILAANFTLRLHPNTWPHVSLDVLILVITIAESFVRRNTKPCSLPRTSTSETTRFTSTSTLGYIFVIWRQKSYSTALSTGIPITTVSAVLLCPKEKLMWPVSLWNCRVSVWTPLLGSCSRWPANSR